MAFAGVQIDELKITKNGEKDAYEVQQSKIKTKKEEKERNSRRKHRESVRRRKEKKMANNSLKSKR